MPLTIVGVAATGRAPPVWPERVARRRRLATARASRAAGGRRVVGRGVQRARPGAAPLRSGCAGWRPAARPSGRRRCAGAPSGSSRRQETDGCWGGIQPPWVYSLIALHLLGYGLDHPVISRGLAGLDASRSGRTRRRAGPAARGLPVAGLGHGAGHGRRSPTPGCRADHPALAVGGRVGARTRRSAAPATGRSAGRAWPRRLGVRVRQRRLPRRRRHRRGGAGAAAGGMADPQRLTPPCDARRRAGRLGMQSQGRRLGGVRRRQHRPARRQAAVLRLRRGHRPAVGRRHRAHGRDAGRDGPGRGHRRSGRGVTWLLRAQEADGSWFGRWGANYVYGTGAVVPALIAAGSAPASRAIRRAVAWLVSHQNPDGGWGEDLRSYDDPTLGGPRRVHRVADRVGAAGAARGRRGRPPEPAASTAACRWLARPSAPTGPGTSRSSPAPASPATSTSTTTCTGWCSRVSALGRYVTGARDATPRHRASAAHRGGAAGT